LGAAALNVRDKEDAMSTAPGFPQTASLDPQPIAQMAFSFAAARILSTAVQLGLFSKIAAGAHTAAAIAQAAGASERGTRMVLDALVGFQLLTKRNGEYGLGPLAAQFLVRESPDYMGAWMETDTMWEAWTKLPEAVRTGKPVDSPTDQGDAEEFFRALVRTLHIQNRLPAQRLMKALGIGESHRGVRVLDVGCGSGVWGIAAAEADPGARVTAQDLSGVLEQTKEYVEKHGLTDRYNFLQGDLHTVEFSSNTYDLAILGHIIHMVSEASARAIFARLHAALKPGGRLAVIDMIPNDERTAPPFPLIFALNMLVHTDEGGTYTLSEYKKWLTEAGFARAEMIDISGGNGIAAVVAQK
jgi:ubiquinone/menaquinone biosynthesis C-methylase UbiE